jgi:hypothetical protein
MYDAYLYVMKQRQGPGRMIKTSPRALPWRIRFSEDEIMQLMDEAAAKRQRQIEQDCDG